MDFQKGQEILPDPPMKRDILADDELNTWGSVWAAFLPSPRVHRRLAQPAPAGTAPRRVARQ